MFEGFKSRFDRLFAEHGAGADPRARAAALREALLEAKVGVGRMRDALAASERELEAERRALADAERRGSLAAGIADSETARLAERFAAKHRDRVGLLERKLVVQREELALAERDTEEMAAELRGARPGAPGAARAGIDSAWRDIEAAGGTRPETDLDGELQRAEADRKLHEAAVEAQLAHLKKKLGKE